MVDTPCPCIVTFAPGTAPLTIPVINYCPLHAAAADLLAACKQGLIGLKELTLVDGSNASNYKDMRDQLEAAIAQAQGE